MTNKYMISTLKEYRLSYPESTLQEIANHFGSTRENIRQKLNRIGLPTRRQNYGQSKDNHCTCGVPIYYRSKHCRKCFLDYHHLSLTCDTCGVSFARRVSLHNYTIKIGYRHIFCSIRCSSRYRRRDTL